MPISNGEKISKYVEEDLEKKSELLKPALWRSLDCKYYNMDLPVANIAKVGKTGQLFNKRAGIEL